MNGSIRLVHLLPCAEPGNKPMPTTPDFYATMAQVKTSTKYRRSKDIEKQFLKSRPAHHPRSICDQHYGAYRMACGLPADDDDDDDAHDDDAADAGDGAAGGGRGGSGAAASAGSSAVEAPTRSKRRQRSESESLRDLAYQTAQEHGVNPQDMLRVLQTAKAPRTVPPADCRLEVSTQTIQKRSMSTAGPPVQQLPARPAMSLRACVQCRVSGH